ncbi:Vacuolar protein 8 [Wickerhamiella sorbophila]|uniref:Vacuolar protein 8 n=1 Tax=Wickerhamiella sorbophila TaxID=45607 RepID=A0A2T0FKF0_9ASCO|nr:Vacuolar protein 8 [Wickerhamiella sorbophila]PRT55474.1 Vacuolar protein 8 [Wickerhamiella sorbophila]
MGMSCCCFPWSCGDRSENGVYAPVLGENERQAVEVLLQYLDNREESDLLSEGALDALTTLVNSDNMDLQRSAALAFAEITEKYIASVSGKVLEPILVLLQSPDAEIQRAAGAALGNLAVNNENKKLIVEMGGLGPLMKQMMSPNVEVQCNAVGCMTNLATLEENKAKIARSGALLPLTKLAKSKDMRVQRNATGALLNMTHSNENRRELVNADAIPVLVSLLSSTDPDVQYYCTTALSNIAVEAENRQRLAQTEPHLVHHLVHLMGSSSPRIQCQAALALRNLASDVNYQVEIVRANGLPLLLNLLQCSHTHLVLAAVACIRNVSIHPLNEAAIVDAGFLGPLVDLLSQTENEEILCHAVSSLRNLAASSEKTKLNIVETGAVQKCIDLVGRVPASVQSEITACIAVLALGDELKGTMLSLGIVKVLVPLTMVDNVEVQGNSAAALGNLSSKVSDYDPFVEAWDEPNGGIYHFLVNFLSSKEPTFEHIAVWMILQLLESEDPRLLKAIAAAPELTHRVEALATQDVDVAGDGADKSYTSQMAVPALARRVVELLRES